jgi:competence protein ComEC
VRGSDFALIYDAGSNDDDAVGPDNRMLAFIKATAPALSAIDHVILSHPHKDHVQLLPDLFAAYAVRQVWDSGRLNDICGYRAFLKAVRDEPNVQYHTAAQDGGDRTYSFPASATCGPAESVTIRTGSRIDNFPVQLGANASMTILHADSAAHSSPNENSLVTKLELGNVRVLFMGDAEAGGRKDPSAAPSPSSIEGALLACCRQALRSDVLIVGHHGSLTSSRSTFLAAVDPSVMVISAGPFPYNHVVLPDPPIVQEMKARGGHFFRTDLNDKTCGSNAAKVGRDADGQPGGCDNVRISISTAGVQADYRRFSDN